MSGVSFALGVVAIDPVPAGGTTGQVLAKKTDSDYDTEWVTGGGGAVDSVNGQTGTVVLGYTDVGAASAAQGTKADSALQPAAIGVTVQAYDADLTSWAAITPSSKQNTLVSGTNIKTINGSSVLGSGDLTISGSFSGGTLTSELILDVGSTSAPPLSFQAGTLTTTAGAGDVEYDGTAFYSSMANSTRGVLPTEQFVILDNTNNLTSQTAAQPLFDGGGGPTNGSITLPVGTYQFECMFALTGMSTTSGSYGFALGGTATKTYTYDALAAKLITLGTGSTAGQIFTYQTGAATAISPTSTAAQGHALIKGILRVTVAGTVIPQVSFTQAAAAVVQAGSYFKISPLGSSTVVTVGNWT